MTTEKKQRKGRTSSSDDSGKLPAGYPRKSIPWGVSVEHLNDSDETGKSFARLLTSPELAALRIVAMQPRMYADNIDTPGMLAVLKEQGEAVNRGDLKYQEAMLANQATALQGLFVRLTERSLEQTHIPNMEGFMRLALRAQNQCRATLETLSAIKNPPVVYAKQANVTTGPQQVNNGVAITPAQEREVEQSKQSGDAGHDLLPDTRASQVESRINPPLEALGEIDRAEVGRG